MSLCQKVIPDSDAEKLLRIIRDNPELVSTILSTLPAEKWRVSLAEIFSKAKKILAEPNLGKNSRSFQKQKP